MPSSTQNGPQTAKPGTRELSIPAMPEHASFIPSKRQLVGGSVTDAGVSNSPTVSVVGIAPLTPGLS
jgi:hypothetical protein